MPGRLTLWLYILAAISVFDEYEQACFQPALTGLLRDMKFKSRDEVGGSLKSVLWVDVLHSAPAKQILEAMLPNSLKGTPKMCAAKSSYRKSQ